MTQEEKQLLKDLDAIFPELKESGDERIRKELYAVINDLVLPNEQRERFNVWLEKQKEQKKDNPLEDFSRGYNAGYYHGITDSEQKPTNVTKDEKKFLEDEVKAFLCNYDKEFDGEDPVTFDVAEHFYMLGKKEQKPAQTETEKQYVRTLKALVSDFIRDRNPEDVPYYQGIFDWLDGRHIEQKPAEWSDEDEKMRRNLMSLLANMRGDRITEETYQKYYPWLKDLRSRPKPSDNWKPSDEQMGALNYAYCELFKREDVEHNILGPLQNLIDTLRKL